MPRFTLPAPPTGGIGAWIERLEFAGAVMWRVGVRGRDLTVSHELFDGENAACDWAIAQADARHLPFLDQCDVEAA